MLRLSSKIWALNSFECRITTINLSKFPAQWLAAMAPFRQMDLCNRSVQRIPWSGRQTAKGNSNNNRWVGWTTGWSRNCTMSCTTILPRWASSDRITSKALPTMDPGSTRICERKIILKNRMYIYAGSIFIIWNFFLIIVEKFKVTKDKDRLFFVCDVFIRYPAILLFYLFLYILNNSIIHDASIHPLCSNLIVDFDSYIKFYPSNFFRYLSLLILLLFFLIFNT